MKSKTLIIFAVIAGVIIGGASVRFLDSSRRTTAKEHKEAKHEEHEGEDKEHGKAVKLHDDEIQEFGIEVKEAGSGKLSVQRELPGEIVPNADRLVHIVPRIPGVAKKIYKNLGDMVSPGEVLAEIESRDLADAKAAYLAALKRVEIAQANMKREEHLWKKKISPELDYLEAKKVFDETTIELSSAEQKLHALGLSEEYLAQLPSQPDVTYTRYEIRAPFAGTVIEKHITLGEYLKEDAEAFVIADLRTVWVNISIYQKDMAYVRKGQPVTIAAGAGIPDVKGVVSYIAPLTGEETRTAVARVVLPNHSGVLRPGLFVTARVSMEEVTVPVLVPKTALVSEGEQSQVFVETGEGFVPQAVTIGRSDDANAEVTAGLKPTQRYVARGGFTLKAQIGKGAFGDGHAH